MVNDCTQRIEQADNRDDTRAIYSEVKRLSDTVSRGANTCPTASYLGPHKSGAAEDSNRAADTWADETVGTTRNSEQEDLEGPKENVTVNILVTLVTTNQRNERAHTDKKPPRILVISVRKS